MTQLGFNAIARSNWRTTWLLLGALGLHHTVQAAITDVAQVPMVTSSASVVKPNIMFILDSSGSMASDYMPDDANFNTGGGGGGGGGGGNLNVYGYRAWQCNGLAYNPNTNYVLPVTSTGANYPAGSYTFATPASLNNQRTITSAAPTIATGSVTVTVNTANNANQVGDVVTIYSNDNPANLMVGTVTAWNNNTLALTVNVTSIAGSGTATNPRIADGDNSAYYYNYNTYTGSPLKLSYTYSGNGVITTTTFYRECNSSIGSTPGSAVFTRVNVTPTSPDLQNYRNWYTYYRTRILMMRSAASLAFQPINDRYRVGFTTISNQYVNGTDFLDIADFTANQKSLFYADLFAANPNNSTPLRGALSKAGKYFAKKGTLSGGSAQTYDPVQYSCQRNFAILTTDGYWNTNDESNSYGPLALSGTTHVGEQDGAGTPRPMNDGVTTGWKERTSTLQQRSVTGTLTSSTGTLQQWPITAQWNQSTSTLQQWSITAQWNQSTSTLQVNTGQLQQQVRVSGNWTGVWTNVDPVHLEQQYAVSVRLERICQCHGHVYGGGARHEYTQQYTLERPCPSLPVHGLDDACCHDDLHGGKPIGGADELHTSHGDPVRRAAQSARNANKRGDMHGIGDEWLRLHPVDNPCCHNHLHRSEPIGRADELHKGHGDPMHCTAQSAWNENQCLDDMHGIGHERLRLRMVDPRHRDVLQPGKSVNRADELHRPHGNAVHSTRLRYVDRHNKLQQVGDRRLPIRGVDGICERCCMYGQWLATVTRADRLRRPSL